MHTTITQTALDTIAPSLNTDAREAAHAACPETPEEFAREYLPALAFALGVARAEQCGPGETWSHTAWNQADVNEMVRHATALGVDLNPGDWRVLWAHHTRAE